MLALWGLRLAALHSQYKDGYNDLFDGLDEENRRKLDVNNHPEHAQAIVWRRKVIAASTPAVLTLLLIYSTTLSYIGNVGVRVTLLLFIGTVFAMMTTLYRAILGWRKARRHLGPIRHSSS
jgi:hypothetical protein